MFARNVAKLRATLMNKRARKAENIGGVCVIGNRDHMAAVGECIEKIPGKKARADAQVLFQLWQHSAEHKFIVFAILADHSGILGTVAADWQSVQMFVMSFKAQLDAGAGECSSHWIQFVSKEQQR